jgi:serine hydrolase
MRDIRDFDILIIPGWDDSGPDHWQTHWELAFPHMRRVQQDDWRNAVFAQWSGRLSEAVLRCRRPVLLVAHSLGTSLVVRWAEDAAGANVAGAFLVAPTDQDVLDESESGVKGFGPMLTEPLPFPSMVLASQNDAFVTLDRARFFAESWEASFVNVGALGHVGSEARLGIWPQGLVWLGQFVASLTAGAR